MRSITFIFLIRLFKEYSDKENSEKKRVKK